MSDIMDNNEDIEKIPPVNPPVDPPGEVEVNATDGLGGAGEEPEREPFEGASSPPEAEAVQGEAGAVPGDAGAVQEDAGAGQGEAEEQEQEPPMVLPPLDDRQDGLTESAGQGPPASAPNDEPPQHLPSVSNDVEQATDGGKDQQPAVAMTQEPVLRAASLRSVRPVLDVRADQGKAASPSSLGPYAGKRGTSNKGRSKSAFRRVHGADQSSHSAPPTPSGSRGTGTVRAHQPSIIAEDTYEDVWGLARRLLEEREEEERLYNAIQEKADTAEYRRSVIQPKPVSTCTTPFSLIASAPVGTIPQPKGWRASWKATSHEELYQSSVQVEKEIVAIKQRQSERFLKELAMRQAEATDKARREADTEQRRVAWHKEQMEKEKQLIAEVNAQKAAVAQNIKERHDARMIRSEKHSEEVQGQTQASLARNALQRVSFCL
eukprot:gene2639-5014_t